MLDGLLVDRKTNLPHTAVDSHSNSMAHLTPKQLPKVFANSTEGKRWDRFERVDHNLRTGKHSPNGLVTRTIGSKTNAMFADWEYGLE